MGITGKGKIHKISMLTLGLLIDIKERISSLVQLRDGSAKSEFKEPNEETPGFEGILPVSENSPDTRAKAAGQLSSDVEVSEEADSQPSYTGNHENIVSQGTAGDINDPSQDHLDPSTEEDIPLRPSEVEIPHEILYDQEGDSQIMTTGQGDSEVIIPEEEIEIETPDKKEIDPKRLLGDRKIEGRNKEREILLDKGAILADTAGIADCQTGWRIFFIT